MLDLTGQKYGRWTILYFEGFYQNKISKWMCQCECGKKSIVLRNTLRNGTSKSCGCLQKETVIGIITIHGQASGKCTDEYTAWKNMKGRCAGYSAIGKRFYKDNNVIVCERWLNSFDIFFADMGKRPSKKHSLDRFPNKTGNYEPSNCRWATKKEQAGNTIRNRYLEYNGETLILNDWAKRLNTTYQAIQKRFRKGESFNEIYKYFEQKKAA